MFFGNVPDSFSSHSFSSGLPFIFAVSQVYNAVAWGEDPPETWAGCLSGSGCFQPAVWTWPAPGAQGVALLPSHPKSYRMRRWRSIFTILYPSGGEGGRPRRAAGLSLYGWRWHGVVHKWRLWPAVAMGTLLSLGLFWWQTIPEQTSPSCKRPVRSAGHVWGPGTTWSVCVYGFASHRYWEAKAENIMRNIGCVNIPDVR